MVIEEKYNWRTFDTAPMLGAGFLRLEDVAHACLYRCLKNYTCALVVEGDLLVELDGHHHTLTVGQLLQCWPDCPLKMVKADEATLLYCITINDALRQSLGEIGLLQTETVFSVHLNEALLHRMALTAKQLRTSPQSRLYEALLGVQRLLIQLHHAAQQDPAQQRARLAELACRRLSEQCLYPQPDVEGIAAELGMNYENFRKFFRQQTGNSPHQYLLERRFEHACRLLQDGVSVQHIASTVGYADPYTFSRQFKRQVGVAPSAYRKEHAETD